MNPYYYVLDDFSDADMEVVRNMFYTKLYPIHVEKAKSSYNKTKSIAITNFRFDDIQLNDNERMLFSKYPMLGTDCLINESTFFGGTPPHIDGKPGNINRMCAINFPIIGGNDQSPTVFYGQLNDYEYYYDANRQTCFLVDNDIVQEQDKVYLINKPVLINVKAWHKVRNFGNSTRIAFSWSCKAGVDFATVYKLMSKND
jgi:hypothetical protein